MVNENKKSSSEPLGRCPQVVGTRIQVFPSLPSAVVFTQDVCWTAIVSGSECAEIKPFLPTLRSAWRGIRER